MARIVLINLGLHGHVNPTLAMVRELVAQGDSVTYFAPQEFAGAIQATGADFQAYRSVFSQPIAGYSDAGGRTPMPIRLLTDCQQSVRQILDRVERLRPDVILFDVMCLQGRIVAETLGLPAIRLSSTFVLHDKIEWKPKAAGDPRVVKFTEKAIGGLCAEFGVRHFQFQDLFTEPAALNLVFTTTHFQPQVELFDQRFAFVGACIGELPMHCEAAREVPFIYVALGTLANNRPDFYKSVARALSGGARKGGVVAVGQNTDLAAIGEFPDGFEVVRHAPQLQVLQSADVFVSHAGMNSLMEALYFGVPMVLFPQTEEQAVNAARANELGVGVVISESDTAGDAISAVLTNSKYLQSAQALRREIHQAGGYRAAVEQLRSFITTGTP